MVTSPITDLVARLRRSGDYECYCEEAADEIELRIVPRQLMLATNTCLFAYLLAGMGGLRCAKRNNVVTSGQICLQVIPLALVLSCLRSAHGNVAQVKNHLNALRVCQMPPVQVNVENKRLRRARTDEGFESRLNAEIKSGEYIEPALSGG
jgi:hypothetical protein